MSFDQKEIASRISADNENRVRYVGSGRSVAVATSPDNRTTRLPHDAALFGLSPVPRLAYVPSRSSQDGSFVLSYRRMADFMTTGPDNRQLQIVRNRVEPTASNHRRHHTKIEKFWLAGSVLLYGGVGLFILSSIDRVSYLPFPMPEFWYSNRGFWPFLSILAIPCGMALLKKEPKLNWQPTLAGPRFGSVVLYTRKRCHLCDDAKILLKTYARWLPTPVEVDIDGDEELKEQFNTCVPVVEIDGKVRFRGIVDEMLLRRLIEGSEPIG